MDAESTPLGSVCAPANPQDSPLLATTLDNACTLAGALAEETIVHLDGGYDSMFTRERLADRGLLAEISRKGKSSPLGTTKRWVDENKLLAQRS